MKTKRNLITLMCLLAITTAWAKPISESQARSIASAFMARHEMPSSSLKMALKAPKLSAPATGENAAFYAFNASRGGYVIVAGDDRVPAVLGYSDKGTFDPEDVPEAMQELLESYVVQIDALDSGAKAAMHLVNAAPIAPMVKAQWSQNNPYNMKLPFINGKHAHVGCVATAMAQVMYYWKWPARTTCAIPGYTSNTLSIVMPALPVVDFDWNNMHDTYETSDTLSTAAMAAATLSQYCAQAVCMDFKTKSSGAYSSDVPIAMINYFGYQHGTEYVRRMHYTTSTWENMLYEELAAGRPVMYSGSKASGGHAFVCDGYAGNGLFHINWGWNGNSNGYFLLNVLNPDEQGTGSAEGSYGYIYSQGAVIGLQPDKGGSHIFELTATNVVLESYVGTRQSTSKAFKAYVSGKFNNYTSDTIAVRYGWGLFNGDEMIANLYSSYTTALRPGYLFTHTNRELQFGEYLSSGTYRIMPMFSEYGRENWRPCVGSDRNYLEVTIDGNNCYFTGHGTAGTPDYVINDISMTGYMHNGRPVDINVNLTNNGLSSNELLHLFINGEFAASGYAGLEQGETGDIRYTYLFANAGNYNLTWSWNDDGTDPIASRTITINAMPAANLNASIKVLDVTDTSNKIITSNKFSVELTITNNGSTTYDEDISVKLYKRTKGTSGTNVQGKNQRLTLAPGATTTMRFDMDNVIDGWKYFAYAYYYSSGTQTTLSSTSSYTIVFPEEPQGIKGDVIAI